MEVTFKQKKLSYICNNEQMLIAEFGRDNAKKIMMRLTELKSVDNLSLISTAPPPRRHKLEGKQKGQFAVDVKQPYRIVFKPNNEPLPVDNDGNIDLKRVTKIIILEVLDYHGK